MGNSTIGRRARSLRWRFMAAIGGLLAVVVVVFSVAAYQAAREGSIDAAGARLEAVSGQIAGLLGNNILDFLEQRAAVTSDARLRDFEVGPDAELPAGLRALLDSLAAAPDELREIALHDARGQPVYRAGRMVSDAEFTPPDGASPVHLSGFRRYDDALGFAAAFRVSGEGEGEEGETHGWLVHHIELTATPESVERITGLIGAGARLVVGGPDGMWTDLIDEVPPPPADVAFQREAGFHDAADGVRVLSVGASVPGTPWMIRIEFPESSVLEAPRALMARLVPFGLVVLGAGLLAGAYLSGRVTRRLDEVIAAASTIAAGDYHGRVPEEGDDELADLARAFNGMADKVETAHDRLEAQVARRTAELHAANQELEAFSYSVSHDLRAPLRAVHGFSRAVLEDHAERLPPEGVADLKRVCAAAERMGGLIDDLLELSRATRAPLTRERLDLAALARDVVEELRTADPGRDGSVDVRIVEPMTAHGDRALLRLVLRNLLENAWKFTSQERRAEIRVEPAEAPHTFVVRDNGAGFDADYVHKLFQPFQRLHASDDFEGTGIGLALCQRIVHRHGGTIRASGREGEGAAFHVSLPGADHARA